MRIGSEGWNWNVVVRNAVGMRDVLDNLALIAAELVEKPP